MSRPTVYLAGPITGLEYDSAQDWRDEATSYLASVGIDAFSPLRAKDYLRSQGALEDQYLDLHPLSSGRGIMTRDRFDCTRRDLVLVNLLGAKRISIGTVMEIAWADAVRTPIVLVMEKDNPHWHAMLNEAVGFQTSSLDAALVIVKAILLPQAEAPVLEQAGLPQEGRQVLDEAGVDEIGGTLIGREGVTAAGLRKSGGSP